MVTAARLGLGTGHGERLLANLRMVAALAAPRPRQKLVVSRSEPIPQNYPVPTRAPTPGLAPGLAPGLEVIQALGQVGPGVGGGGGGSVLAREALDGSDGSEESLAERPRNQALPAMLPRVPVALSSRPASDAGLAHFDPPTRRRTLASKEAAKTLGTSSASASESALGVRPRLKSWSGDLWRVQPVVDLCSFDLKCVAARLLESDEMGKWWQQADARRRACCCEPATSQGAPPQCAAFKTRGFLPLPAFLEESSGGEEQGGHRADWRPKLRGGGGSQGGGRLIDHNQSWSFEQELSWIRDLGRRPSAPSGRGAEPGEPSSRGAELGDAMLASALAGSGQAFTRLVLEYATGVFTG